MNIILVLGIKENMYAADNVMEQGDAIRLLIVDAAEEILDLVLAAQIVLAPQYAMASLHQEMEIRQEAPNALIII